MYWFAGTCTLQHIINTAKLPVLSRILKKSVVTKGLILSRNIKPFSNLYYDCAESVVQRFSKTSGFFQVLAKLPLNTTETELGYYHHRWSVRAAPIVALTSYLFIYLFYLFFLYS